MPQSAPRSRRSPARLTLVAAATVSALLAAMVSTPTATATASAPRGTSAPLTTVQVGGPTTEGRVQHTMRPERALARAKAALSPATKPGKRPDATMALRALALVKDRLSPDDRAAAEALAGRPVKPSAIEGGNIRLHYNALEFTGPFDQNDALNTMVSVSQAFSTGGYRQPKADGSLGGNAKTDVYIDQLPLGLYGYCTSDDPNIGQGGKYDTWAFCVLDNDYLGFPMNTPLENLQVTAAHEYYHAVQFAYDIQEDGWFMEATAAWAEDEIYDGVDDNVQYLASSPIKHPQRSMDKFGGSFHYGAWIFFRYLSEKFPQQKGQLPKLLLNMWKAADSSKGPSKDRYSTQAINKVLSKQKLPLDKAFSLFSDLNRRTHTGYEEGAANNYPVKKLEGKKTLRNKGQGKRFKAKLNHLTSATFRYTPDGLGGSKFKLRLNFDMAPKAKGSRAVVSTYKQSGGVKTKVVRLNGQGNGVLKASFSSSSVKYVEVTLINASTRYTQCYVQSTPFSCSGKPVDQAVRSAVRGTVTKG